MTSVALDPHNELVGVLVMSHGTPRSLEELPRFYTEIRRGSPPTPELLADLERRYLAIGGVSPLTEVTAAQVAGITRSLEMLRPGRYVVASGTKFASPRIEDAVAELAEVGARRAIGIVLAPHSSVTSVGDYIRRARHAANSPGASGNGPLALEVVDHWYEDRGLVLLLAERVREALSLIREAGTGATEVLFTAHSVPTRFIDEGDDYAEQVQESAGAVADAAGVDRWRVAWQSAGRTDETWLGPDVCEVISAIAGSGCAGVVLCPIGFVSDHLEVLYDLDIEAGGVAARAGLTFARTASLNDDARFCEVLARVVLAADADTVTDAGTAANADTVTDADTVANTVTDADTERKTDS
jgi:ferrochelatase